MSVWRGSPGFKVHGRASFGDKDPPTSFARWKPLQGLGAAVMLPVVQPAAMELGFHKERFCNYMANEDLNLAFGHSPTRIRRPGPHPAATRRSRQGPTSGSGQSGPAER